MKKLLYMILLSLFLLSGCEKKVQEITPAKLFVMDGTATADGIKAGDGPEEFKAAYRRYPIQVAYDEIESSYLRMEIDEIPYEDPISTIITGLFVDGKPASAEKLCQKHEISSSELHSLLSSHDYLRKHEVIYRYMIFSWKDGRITDIASEELNYNETFETPTLKM